jgi:hypothetical protein
VGDTLPLGRKYDRPTGHLGAAATQAEAARAVQRDLFGPYYKFMKNLGSLPIIYTIIGWLVNRENLGWIYAIAGLLYSFIWFVKATGYFAAKANHVLESGKSGTFGWIWSKVFIPRALLHHVIIMGSMIYIKPPWLFMVIGLVVYIVDYAITVMTSRLPSAIKAARDNKE